MDFLEYQRLAAETNQVPVVPGSDLTLPLLGIAGEAGELISEYKKYLRDGDAHQLFTERVAEELGDILWYVSSAASKFGLSLDEIANRNLQKARDSWSARGQGGGGLLPLPPYDASFPEHERFRRQFSVHLSEIAEGDVVKVRAICDGQQMGEHLTDNAYADDGYRFHDVFHLACIAGLGWSPVSRRNLKRKRRSDPTVDEVEDGGRATVIEEGVTALVFSYATEHAWLKGVKAIDHDLLKTVKKMTAHLEVAQASISDWERTILMGYAAWREILGQRGGTVYVDMDQRAISVQD